MTGKLVEKPFKELYRSSKFDIFYYTTFLKITFFNITADLRKILQHWEAVKLSTVGPRFSKF